MVGYRDAALDDSAEAQEKNLAIVPQLKNDASVFPYIDCCDVGDIAIVT